MDLKLMEKIIQKIKSYGEEEVEPKKELIAALFNLFLGSASLLLTKNLYMMRENDTYTLQYILGFLGSSYVIFKEMGITVDQVYELLGLSHQEDVDEQKMKR